MTKPVEYARPVRAIASALTARYEQRAVEPVSYVVMVVLRLAVGAGTPRG